MKTTLVIALMLATLAGAAGAQDAKQRAAELAEIPVQLSDPDPMMRLAYFEDIIATGDRRKIQLATNLAMSSDDRALRGAGMLSYMAQQKQIEFDVTYPGPLEDKFLASQHDSAKLKNFFEETGRVGSSLYYNGRKLNVSVAMDEDLLGGTSALLVAGRSAPGDLRVNGDRVEMAFETFAMNGNSFSGCSMFIMPSGEGVIAGEFRCGALAYPISTTVR